MLTVPAPGRGRAPQNMLHQEAGNCQDALDHLDSCENAVVDKTSWKQYRGRLLLQLGRFDEAKAVFNTLLKANPENFGYHAGLQAAVLRTATVTERWLEAEVSEDTEQTLRALYADLQQRFPRSNVCRRHVYRLLPLRPPTFPASAPATAPLSPCCSSVARGRRRHHWRRARL